MSSHSHEWGKWNKTSWSQSHESGQLSADPCSSQQNQTYTPPPRETQGKTKSQESGTYSDNRRQRWSADDRWEAASSSRWTKDAADDRWGAASGSRWTEDAAEDRWGAAPSSHWSKDFVKNYDGQSRWNTSDAGNGWNTDAEPHQSIEVEGAGPSSTEPGGVVEVGVIVVPEVWICRQMNIEAGDENANRMVPFAICVSNPQEGIFTHAWNLLGIVDNTKSEYGYSYAADDDSDTKTKIEKCSPENSYAKIMFKKSDPRAVAIGIGHSKMQQERAAKLALAILQYLRKAPADRNQFRFEGSAKIQSQFVDAAAKTDAMMDQQLKDRSWHCPDPRVPVGAWNP